MTIHFFEGPAGSGKTTSLMEQVKAHLTRNPLDDAEQLLGLTHMHGARHRLLDKLGAIPELKHKYQCSTFDSLAWRIVNRWSALEQYLGGNQSRAVDYDSTCSRAAVLLSYEEVRTWVSRTYPILVVDEAQDCKGGRFQILQELSKSSELYAAADDFQDLSADPHNPCVDWLRTNSQTTILGENHRTTVDGLLVASGGIRRGEGFIRGRKCELIGAWQAAGAATLVAKRLIWYGTRDVVILTPTKAVKAPFVKGTVERLGQRNTSKTLPRPVGPYIIEWEPDLDEMVVQLNQAIRLPEPSGTLIRISDLDFSKSALGMSELKRWVEKQHALRGINVLSVEELQQQIASVCQSIKSHRSIARSSCIRAMTIHQAKNREFEGVVVLWPFQVRPGVEVQKRLIYNAITRAKNWCTVIAQDPEKTRLNEPPFTVLR